VDPQRLADLARRHGIKLLLQFGSSVSGRVHPRSDLDLAVLLDRMPKTLAAELDLMADLQDLVRDREVDLAIINRADPLFLKKITDNCRILYGRERQLYELKIYAFKRYQDHRRYLAMERDYVERKIRALTPTT
jgi:predicted nucleotidyltransferase